ncbi:MAG: type II toxin-antitoxin system VapC family toxin [Verrucomicrobiota bacterium]
MKLLVDTHALLWMVSADPRLPQTARALILQAPELYWSVSSFWEIGIKLSLNRPDFQLALGWANSLTAEFERNGMIRLQITTAHCAAVSRLDWHHRDPFDRMLVAQALEEKMTILSADPQMDAYGISRVW